MNIWEKTKSLLGLTDDKGVDGYGIDHSGFSLRDELNYQMERADEKEEKQKKQRKVENDLLMDGMDVLYGINRTVNGMTFGGLDWLGNKLGIDTQMNNYLSLKDPKSRKITQTAGKVAELGGEAIIGVPVGAAGYNEGNMMYQGYKIGKAYDKLKKNPYQGRGSDIIARMKNHNGEKVILQRGEAIAGENGKVLTSGRTLQRITGTERNYGLDKIIYKHEMPRNEVIRIPRYLKRNQAVDVSPRGQNVYSIQRPNGEIRLVTTPRENYNTISSMYMKNR